MSVRWCGVTSAVTRTPRAFAARMSSTEPAVLTCAMCTCAPVASASAMSRATIVSSAAAGTPRRPRRVETQPSCMTPPAASAGSSQWSMIGSAEHRGVLERAAHEVRVGDRRAVVAEGDAPACASSPSSASSLPARPRVTQPIGSTRTCALRLGGAQDVLDQPARSIGGSVLGIAQTVVKPPRAAASVPVAIVSLYSKPGSRRCVCRSTKPGQTTRPLASIGLASHRCRRSARPRRRAVVDQHVGDAVEAVRRVDHAAAADGERSSRLRLSRSR